MDVLDHSVRFAIDRVSAVCEITLTLACREGPSLMSTRRSHIWNHADILRSWPDTRPDNTRKELITKLLSQDPANYPDAPTEGIRRLLERITGQIIPRGTPLPTEKIGELER